MVEKYCCPPQKPKPDRKEPFPAMSAHFAHTLDDMKDKYLQAQYITIDAETGTLETEILKKLLFSRSNMIVYQDRIFRFANQEGYLCKYINLYNLDGDKFYKAQQININSLTGSWQVIDLESDSKEEITVVEKQITDIQNDIQNITENVTSLNTTVETEINDRKEAIEQVIQDTTDSFNAVKDELEVMDNELQDEISTRESEDQKLQEAINKNSEDIESIIEEASTEFKNVYDEIDQMGETITNITEKVDNIGESLNMDGGEVLFLPS